MENLAPISGDVDKSVGALLSLCIHYIRMLRCLPVKQGVAIVTVFS